MLISEDKFVGRAKSLTPLRVLSCGVSLESDRAEVDVYRPFFLAGIISVLTVGCLLGAISLIGIASKGSFTQPAWSPFILAHANSQLFGWVGFFVMGFAMQQHGTSKKNLLAFRRLANWTLGLMSTGIVVRFAAEYLAALQPGRWTWMGILAGMAQLIAVVLFFVNTGRHRFRSHEPIQWPALFVFSSLGCLLLISILDPVIFAFTHQTDSLSSTLFLARWMSPLRELQFLGFVSMMIFGVAASKFPGCLGFRPVNRAWGLLAYGAWMSGLALRVAGWSIYFDHDMERDFSILYRLGADFLWLGAVAMSLSLRVFEHALKPNASQQFIRAAFGWLLVAGVLLLLEPFHLAAFGAPFSHAYTGGIRHALTVGFISQMILGVGYHLASRMKGDDQGSVSLLAFVWLLINLGNLGRVSLEIATDYSRAAYGPMGITGVIELAGFAIWAFVMV